MSFLLLSLSIYEETAVHGFFIYTDKDHPTKKTRIQSCGKSERQKAISQSTTDRQKLVKASEIQNLCLLHKT